MFYEIVCEGHIMFIDFTIFLKVTLLLISEAQNF